MAIIEEKTSPNLPPEIIEIILSKLSPVKSLLRFKTVCKSWNTIISHPVFVQNHLRNSSDNLFVCTDRNYSKGMFSLVKLEGRKFHTEAILKNSVYNEILCECNGVLLLSDSRYYCKEYMLWNPFTRAETYFESPYANLEYNNGDYLVNHGVCYDSLADDFKVVLIVKRSYAIYSCKNNSWTEKKLLGTQYHNNIDCLGIYVDGAVYWLLGHNQNTSLVYFDPRIDDELKTLQKPEKLRSDDDDDGDHLFISLTCLRGKLCLYCNDERTKTIQIWMLENRDDWKEPLVIAFGKKRTLNPWCGRKPLCYVGNKILIRLDDKRFVYYSPYEKKTFQEFKTDVYRGHELLPYRNSLHAY